VNHDITKRWSQKTSEPNNDLLGWDVDWCLLKPFSDRSISSMIQDVTHGVKVAAGATASTWASIDTDSDYNVVKCDKVVLSKFTWKADIAPTSGDFGWGYGCCFSAHTSTSYTRCTATWLSDCLLLGGLV
jgi:hypothetical protein